MSRKPIIEFRSERDENRQCWIHAARGKFIGCQICYDFLDAARDSITAETPHVVIDLQDVTMFNSTGIGIIASLLNEAKEVGGKVYLAGVSSGVRRPLEATMMWSLLNISASLDDLPEAL